MAVSDYKWKHLKECVNSTTLIGAARGTGVGPRLMFYSYQSVTSPTVKPCTAAPEGPDSD